MYSKNDFRYYRENRLMHSDDFLAHYGVKGMKWKVRKINYGGYFEGNDFSTRGRGLAIENESTGKEYGVHYAKWGKGKNPKNKALVFTKENRKRKNAGKLVDKTKGRINVFGDKAHKEVTIDLNKRKPKKKSKKGKDVARSISSGAQKVKSTAKKTIKNNQQEIKDNIKSRKRKKKSSISFGE